MRLNGNHIRVALIIFFLAAPAVSIRILSNFTDDPYLQPLALTEEGLAAVGEGGGAYGMTRINVRVKWGRGFSGRLTRNQLRHSLAKTLDGQTDLYYLDFSDAPGDRIGVTFVVGANSYGPYPPGRMVDGLNSALIALRMANRPES